MRVEKDIFVFSGAIKKKLASKSSFEEKDASLRSITRKCLNELDTIHESDPTLPVAVKNLSSLTRQQRKLYWKRFAFEKLIIAVSIKREELLASTDSRINWIGAGKKTQLIKLGRLLKDAGYISKDSIKEFQNNFNVSKSIIIKKRHVKRIKWNGYFFSLIYLIYLMRTDNLIDASHIWIKLSKTFKKKNGREIINTECPRLYNRITGYRDKNTNKTVILFPKDASILDEIIKNILPTTSTK